MVSVEDNVVLKRVTSCGAERSIVLSGFEGSLMRTLSVDVDFVEFEGYTDLAKLDWL